MQSGNHAAVHTLPAKHSEQKVELSLERHEEEVLAVLRYSTWTDGLGWCGQKTIQIAAEQLDDLHHAITVARHHLNRQRAEAGQVVESAQVIQFPTIG
ncbi:MAG: hypothetical protein ACR2GW_13900 [Pyrinomonadaceae bacterium]|nr:hypothetical protein [Pyrinomonadaceae bacterium]MDQ3584567.1 hypothetical protein [Acidobacteriota bacterium]